MTSLPKGCVIPRLKAGQHSVVVRDGQNRAANAAAGCDSREQLFAKNWLLLLMIVVAIVAVRQGTKLPYLEPVVA